MAVERNVLRGRRVTLTPLQMANIYTHFEWNNDPELNHFDSELPYEAESFGAFKRRFERMVFHPTPEGQDFEIHDEEGTLIGVAYLSHLSPHHRHCRIGLTIGDRAAWGQGYGRDAMTVLLEYCFNQLGLHRVSTDTFEYNTAWRKLVRDTGFIHEGTAHDYLYRDGKYWALESYALLESAYRQGVHFPVQAQAS